MFFSTYAYDMLIVNISVFAKFTFPLKLYRAPISVAPFFGLMVNLMKKWIHHLKCWCIGLEKEADLCSLFGW